MPSRLPHSHKCSSQQRCSSLSVFAGCENIPGPRGFAAHPVQPQSSPNLPTHWSPPVLAGAPSWAPNPRTGPQAASRITPPQPSSSLMHAAQRFGTLPSRPSHCLQILRNTSSHFWHGLLIYFKEKWDRACGSVFNGKRDLEMKSQLA